MLIRRNPDTMAPPFSAYSLGVEAPASARWLFVAGQAGVAPDGSLAEGAEGQIERTFLKVLAVLKDAGMEAENLVKITVYMTNPENLPDYRKVRDRVLKTVEPASTLVFISALANPEWLVEIEAIAAAP